MGLLADLPAGRRGVRFTPPLDLAPIDTDDRPDVLYAPDRSLAWQFFLERVHLDLRPQHHELLRRDAHRCARDVFIHYASLLEPGRRSLRTDDPTWSPLIEVTPTQHRGVPVLTAIHRMSYQAGHEFVMGHLLVPIRAGTFELRLLARADMTGVRETLLVAPVLEAARASGEDRIAAAQRLDQTYFDDPKHDARFPDHPISRIRRALAWILEQSDLEVIEPAEPHEDGELAFAELGNAFVPPPRYRQADFGKPFPQFTRFSFTPTDGLHLLSISRYGGSIPARDAAAVERLARRIADESDPQDGSEFTIDIAVDDPDHARVLHCYPDTNGPRHTTHHVFRCPDGTVLLPTLDAPRSTPAEELDADITAMLATLRPLVPAKKRWWHFRN